MTFATNTLACALTSCSTSSCPSPVSSAGTTRRSSGTTYRLISAHPYVRSARSNALRTTGLAYCSARHRVQTVQLALLAARTICGSQLRRSGMSDITRTLLGAAAAPGGRARGRASLSPASSRATARPAILRQYSTVLRSVRINSTRQCSATNGAPPVASRSTARAAAQSGATGGMNSSTARLRGTGSLVETVPLGPDEIARSQRARSTTRGAPRTRLKCARSAASEFSAAAATVDPTGFRSPLTSTSKVAPAASRSERSARACAGSVTIPPATMTYPSPVSDAAAANRAVGRTTKKHTVSRARSSRRSAASKDTPSASSADTFQ
mmetsp:Transcript_3220/g.7974  ORF Transcript_3220/g.7974 Transcript_3220/m.7974 type:complete len:325 (-) Transcript_3220:308-1282(-)